MEMEDVIEVNTRAPLPRWDCTDGSLGRSVTVAAATAAEAVAEYAKGCTRAMYGFDAEGVAWVYVAVRNVATDERDWSAFPLPAVAPPCVSDAGHAWATPVEVVGTRLPAAPLLVEDGIGSVTVCAHCGVYRGVTGDVELAFSAADAVSLAWIQAVPPPSL